MCAPKIKTSAPAPVGAAPAAPLPTADSLRMQERTASPDGTVNPDTARARRTLRTDIRVPGTRTGVNIPRMAA
jgi:hypothetical protein